MQAIKKSREGVTSPLNVNVIFQIPGDVLSPDFSGVRTGYFSKKSCTLIVQVGLPVELPEDVDGYLKECVLLALGQAEGWAKSRHIAENLEEIRQIAEMI